ncbi:hypothetical protein GGR58DRAFT_475096 [Xylaria digitata]|nr:hypothetical protein GGR58DRAFT_475096 [Xylaria digitata]
MQDHFRSLSLHVALPYLVLSIELGRGPREGASLFISHNTTSLGLAIYHELRLVLGLYLLRRTQTLTSLWRMPLFVFSFALYRIVAVSYVQYVCCISFSLCPCLLLASNVICLCRV